MSFVNCWIQLGLNSQAQTVSQAEGRADRAKSLVSQLLEIIPVLCARAGQNPLEQAKKTVDAVRFLVTYLGRGRTCSLQDDAAGR